MKTGVIFLIVLLVMSLASLSWARQGQERYRCPQHKRAWGQHPAQFNLNLTPQQKEETARLRLSFQEETIDYRALLAKKRIELQKLLTQTHPNRDKINALVEEMATIQAQINKKFIDFVLRARNVLTREQRDKLPPSGIWHHWQWK